MLSTQSKLDDAQSAEVLVEMNRILADPKFGSSKRCVKLFRYIIENAVSGDQTAPKERTLGIEVFGRDADYDTNLDPVVRMAAREVRKRLAQYYQDSDHVRAVTFRLAPGGYVPEFDFDQKDTRTEPIDSPVLTASAGEDTPTLCVDKPPVKLSKQSIPLRTWARRTAGATLLLLVVGTAMFRTSPLLRWMKYVPWALLRELPKYPQWQPFFDSSESPILCIADRNAGQPGRTNPAEIPQPISNDETASDSGPVNDPIGAHVHVDFVDANAAHKVSLLLRTFGQTPLLRPSSAISRRDLRFHPMVLIGGPENPWSVKVLSNLRYSIHLDPLTGERWIQDTQNPSKRDWKANASPSQMSTDYAVVARFYDSGTRQWNFVLAGLFSYGTEAACELMTEATMSQLVPSVVGFSNNFEMVVRTHVADNAAGLPQVVDVYSW